MSAPLKLTLLVVVCAICGVALKAHMFRVSSEAVAANLRVSEIGTFLAREGYSVSHPPHSGITWIDGTKGSCIVRVADVSPDGWFEQVVKEQTKGELLKFAFGGAFYDQQPTVRTKASKYKAQFLQYFLINSAPVLVRAVSTSYECSADVFSQSFALGLS